MGDEGLWHFAVDVNGEPITAEFRDGVIASKQVNISSKWG